MQRKDQATLPDPTARPRSGRSGRRRTALGAALLALAAGMSFTALAQGSGSYPSRTVRIVVPYPAGSQVDVAGRVLAKEMGEYLKQSFVVENKPGASTLIGAELVAKSPPDGHTLLVTTNTTSAANKSLFKTLPYDPIKDFSHIGRIVTTSLVLVGRPDLPAANLRELLAYARASSKPISVGHFSAGSQVAVSNFKNMGRIEVIPVPYKGSPLAVTDVAGGQADLTFTDFTTALPQIRGGKLKGYGVTSAKRSALAPDLPAIAEELPGYAVTTWIGLVAPAGTPDPVVARINEALNAALAKPEVKERFTGMGFEVSPSSPAEFASFVASEIDTWRKHVTAAGIQPQ